MKDSFIFEGKKYISSRRASEISDYASDYIGQLCRAGKLDARMVGRTWFVTEESIRLHQATVLHDEINRNRIENLRGKKAKTSVRAEEEIKEKEVAEPQTVVVPKVQEEVNIEEKKIKYLPDERPLLPLLLSKEETIESLKSDNEIKPEELQVTITEKIQEEAKKENISKEEKAREPEMVSEEMVATPAVSLPVASYPELTRSIILRRALASVVVIAFVVTAGIFGTGLMQNPKVASNESSQANVFQAFQTLGTVFSRGYDTIASLLKGPERLSISDAGNSNGASNVPDGIAVTSSTGSVEGDNDVKEKIRGSFSDEVEVHPDQSGTAGVIKPVFRSNKGNDFVYVMVPIVSESQ